jgi:penicillin-binding protein 2
LAGAKMRNDDSMKSQIFARRAFLFLSAKVSVLTILAARLYYLQILKSDEYKTLSENNHVKLFLIPPARGNIVDRLGNPLAINQKHYRAIFNKISNKNFMPSIVKVSQLLDISLEEQEQLIKKIKQAKLNSQILIKDSVSWQEVAILEVNCAELAHILIDIGQRRYYPFSNLCSHIVGYVGNVSEEKLQEKQLFSHPDFKVGKNGIEKVFEDKLRGKVGVKKVEVNAYGNVIREIAREESKQGEEIALTLDIRLQEYVVDKMNNRNGAAIVMDLFNGDVLAFVSTPSYNSNLFTKGISTAYWEQLVEDEGHPLVNKVIAGLYPPGSIFKIIVALTALKEGINPNDCVYCAGYVTLGKRSFHCAKKEGHGFVDMTKALAVSCNCYFYSIGKRINLDNLITVAEMLNIGRLTGIELPGEQKGNIPNKHWKKAQFSQEWQMGDTLNTSIGQGFTLVTPLQAVTMIARVATGKEIAPHLIYTKSSDKLKREFKNLDLSEGHLNIVRQGLISVVNSPYGTAYNGRTNEGYTIAGKTSTIQIASKKVSLGMPGNDKLKLHHAMFAAYIFVDNEPRFAAVLLLEHGVSGSAAAALTKDILIKTSNSYVT